MNSVHPTVKTSPSASWTVPSIRRPFTSVPLLLPKSVMKQSSPTHSTRTWLRDARMSGTTMSLSELRPILTWSSRGYGRPAWGPLRTVTSQRAAGSLAAAGLSDGGRPPGGFTDGGWPGVWDMIASWTGSMPHPETRRCAQATAGRWGAGMRVLTVSLP